MARGRGRLSSIDILPPEAEEDIAWAFRELKKRKLTQSEILDQFNLRLKLKGLGAISSSAFNRASLRLSRMATRLEETREIANVLASKFEEGGKDDVGMLLGETVKVLVYEMLENAGKLKADGETAEMLMNAARALKHSEEARRLSVDSRTRIDREFAAKAEKAVEAIARQKGLSAETVAQIRASILGLTEKAQAA